MRPLVSDYDSHFEDYVSLIKSDDIRQVLADSLPDLEKFLQAIPEHKSDFAYAEGKWTVKEVLQHGIDSERVFAYRAMCIARGEQQSLPSFDDKLYASNASMQHRSLRDLSEELLVQRRSSILLFKYFTDDRLQARGLASGKPVTVLAMGYILAGHWQHHQHILRDRYLV